MRKIRLGHREFMTQHLSLSDRIRMGDLACIRTWLEDWRLDHPAHELVVYYDQHHHASQHSRKIPPEWVFGGLVDELWLRDGKEKHPAVKGARIVEFYDHKAPNYVNIWTWWLNLRKTRRISPNIQPTPAAVETAQRHLRTKTNADKFVVLQPLMDAPYNTYRNAPAAWWRALATALHTRGIPTVLIGPPDQIRKLGKIDGVIDLSLQLHDPFVSMGLISKAAVHIGGETGLPLWSCLFGTPVIFTSRAWKIGLGDPNAKAENYDFRPIDYHAPVLWGPLEGDVNKIAADALGLVNGQITESSTY